jgi:predicted membrane-bound spermidine synthase
MTKQKTISIPAAPVAAIGATSGLSLLYCISFIEGGVVMVAELAGAKILTPFFGASLYSWASTLSITLLALMAGYYYGGYATTKERFRSRDKIVWIFLLSGLMVLLMPGLGLLMMKQTISFPFLGGLIISELFFLFPPIFLMGMISPMIIYQITKDAAQSGRSAGNIYAISTSGGILFTLVFGFLIIPHYGITIPVRILGLLVALFALLILLKARLDKPKAAFTAVLVCVVAAISFAQHKSDYFPHPKGVNVLESSEGLLGELEIYDEPMIAPGGRRFFGRKLTTSNVLQDYVVADSPTFSLMYYVNFTDRLLSFLPRKDSALLIGLGTGSLYAVLRDHNVAVETVELDQRIYDYGVKYFGMKDHPNHFVTDGRYRLNVTDKKYDLVMLDVIIGENVPGQLISLEAFKRCRDILKDDGTLIIEHGAVRNFEDNSFIPSVAKTLNEAGFQVTIFNPIKSTAQGDLLLVASIKKFDLANKEIPSNFLLKGGALADYELPITAFDNASATILTDDINSTDILLKSHYFIVRENVREELAKRDM